MTDYDLLDVCFWDLSAHGAACRDLACSGAPDMNAVIVR